MENPKWFRSGARQLVVSGRTPLNELEGMALFKDSIKSDDSVINIGAGFSMLTQELCDEGVLNAYSLDPLYIDLVADNEYATVHKIAKRHPGFISFMYLENDKKIPRKNLMSGDVHQLPLRDNSFNWILSNRLFEHVDLGLAIPEMFRILKEDGEIRMGGCILDLFIARETLICGDIGYDGYDGWTNYVEANNFKEGIEKVLELGAQVYISLNGAPKRSEVRKLDELGVFIGGVVIIRKDDVVPSIEGLSKNPDHYAYLKRLVGDKIVHMEKIFKIQNKKARYREDLRKIDNKDIFGFDIKETKL